MRTLLAGVIGGLIVLLPAAAHGDDSDLELELTALAKSIASVLRDRDAESADLGAFKCKRDPEISHGPGICQRLKHELSSLGIKVRAKAPYLIEGEYSDKIDKTSRRAMIELTCNVVERKAKTSTLVKYFKRGLFGQEAYINFLTPPAVVLNPSATREEREESFITQNDSDQPIVRVHGSKIFAGDKEEYGIEILVKKGAGYAARMPELKEGKLYVPLKKGEPFAVRLVNNSNLAAGATIHIDGLDVFSFSELMNKGGAAPRWTVSKKKERTVPGWPIRAGLADEFLVTEYAKSAVAELNAAGNNVGVITVTFAAAWPKGVLPPEDEKARNGTAVGRGAPIDAPFEIVPMNFGSVRAVLNIRYQR